MHEPIDFNKRTDQFVRLRDGIKKIKEKHAAELKPYFEAIEQLEAMLLDYLNKTGQDSARSASGTVYKTTKRSATIADADAFRKFVITQQAWQIADWKANAPAVEVFIEEHKAPPPGVNYSTRLEVGVRRSS